MSSTITALTSGGGLAMAGDTSGQLELKTNNGTTAVTIDASQNVGIGTSSPVNNSGYGGLTLNGTSGSLFSLMTNGTETGRIASLGNETSIQCKATTGIISFVQGVSGGTERMRIDSSGNLLINLTTSVVTATNTLQVASPSATNCVVFRNTNASTPYGPWINFTGTAPNNTTQYYLVCEDTTNTKLFIYSNGTVSNRTGTYNTISDAKLKENIVDATPKLDKLMDVKVRNYNLIGDELKQIGFVAQELEQIFPSLVEDCVDTERNKDGDIVELNTVTKNVKSSVMIPILVKAIQELNAKVDAQALEIQALKGVA